MFTFGSNDVEVLEGVVYNLIMCVSNTSVIAFSPLYCRMPSTQVLEHSVSGLDINMLIYYCIIIKFKPFMQTVHVRRESVYGCY